MRPHQRPGAGHPCEQQRRAQHAPAIVPLLLAVPRRVPRRPARAASASSSGASASDAATLLGGQDLHRPPRRFRPRHLPRRRARRVRKPSGSICACARASSHARGSNYQVLFKLVSSKATAARMRAYAFNSSAMGNQHAGASAHTAPTGYQTAKLLAAKCMRALANRMHQQLAAGASSGRVRAGAHLPASPPTALSSGCSYLQPRRCPACLLRRLRVQPARYVRPAARPPVPRSSGYLCLVRLRLAISSGCYAPAPVRLRCSHVRLRPRPARPPVASRHGKHRLLHAAPRPASPEPSAPSCCVPPWPPPAAIASAGSTSTPSGSVCGAPGPPTAATTASCTPCRLASWPALPLRNIVRLSPVHAVAGSPDHVRATPQAAAPVHIAAGYRPAGSATRPHRLRLVRIARRLLLLRSRLQLPPRTSCNHAPGCRPRARPRQPASAAPAVPPPRPSPPSSCATASCGLRPPRPPPAPRASAPTPATPAAPCAPSAGCAAMSRPAVGSRRAIVHVFYRLWKEKNKGKGDPAGEMAGWKKKRDRKRRKAQVC
nr:uncharacterized protein LOC127303237 [Lolium perenne]